MEHDQQRVEETGEESGKELTIPARLEHGAGVLRLLDREPPDGYVQEWTNRIYQEATKTEQGALSLLIFRVGGEWLGLPTSVVQEVASVQSIHSIPHRRGGALVGLASVRGELLVCVSLRAMLELEGTAETATERVTGWRLLVVNRETHRAAFPVEEVYGVQRYQPEEIREVPTTFSRGAATYTMGLLPWRDKTVGCLDDALLFYALDKSLS